ncbi:MAG: tetratricopeptide repeat protein [Blastocatellia bacterium]
MTERSLSIIQGALLALNFLLMFVPIPGRGAWKEVGGNLTALLIVTTRQVKESWQTFARLAITGSVVLLLWPFSVTAQTTATDTTAPAITSGALPDDIVALRREANDAVYNLDYTTARAKFEEIRRRLPDHPAGDLYLATLIWLDQLNRSRRLQTGIYQNESFYAGADKAKEETEGDAVDPAVDRQFRDTINRAKTKALALVNRTAKKDPDALYFLGTVYGVMGSYDASVARKFIGALRNGSRCVDYHQQVVKLKPDFYDAYMSIGLYNYIVGSLPFPLKALAAMVGTRGSRSKGLAMLEDAMNKGHYINDDARVILIAIYQNEKRPEDALKQLQNLSQRFPRNYLIRLETASTLSQLQRSAEAFAIYEELLKSADAGKAVDLIHYQYAEALASGQQFERAAEQFLAVPKTAKAEPGLITWSLLRAAQVYDLAGKRTEALAQYRSVLARPNVYDTREQAERGLKQPFREKERKRAGDE